MKKVLLLTGSALAMMVVTVNAQIDETQMKNDLKKLYQQEKVDETEVREDKKELRKLEDDEVNGQSRQAFFMDFGSIPVTWTTNTYFDKATFTRDGKTMIAYYDQNANLIGTATYNNFRDLPVKAQIYIDKKYSSYGKDVILFHESESNETDMVLYGVELNNTDNYFVALTKNNQTIILRVDTIGDVYFFKRL